MQIKVADTLKKLPPYLFVEIDRAKRKARQEGKDLIDLGIGDPDTPTPGHIIEALYAAAKDPRNHRYALDAGMLELREEIACWYKERFGISLSAADEILPLIGSKEGIAHIPFAFLNKNDVSLVPDPAYPAYRNATILAGGKPHIMPLLEKNAFLPELGAVPKTVLKRAKLLFLNYPNNPTSAVVPQAFLKEAVAFAKKHGIIICFDLAYSEMCFDGYAAPAILPIRGAKDVAVEFHSLSKTYNMTGWRIGWVCGNKEIVAAVAKIKSNIDSGIFQAIQCAGIAALKTDNAFIRNMSQMYKERRDVLVEGLQGMGWNVVPTKATFYVWAKIPQKTSSIDFCNHLLQDNGVVATPGVGFGKYGEGYLRFALTQKTEKIREALQRLARV
ncbi:MAG: LL-diaminopimelate aminotransferase [Candidatus Omnitrophica bacterium]|nr:LL-diaminopimelate aminotransferase [Candidatus Omnitrophota bacterium]